MSTTNSTPEIPAEPAVLTELIGSVLLITLNRPAAGNSINAVPKAAISAVTQSTLAVMLLNVIFAYLVYGVALFGLFTAEQ